MRSSNLYLGKTIASDSTSTPTACGDVRDQIIKEYKDESASFHPVCSDFNWIRTWPSIGQFEFLTLTPTQSTGYGQWALIQSYMATNLRAAFDYLGTSPTITSGYRNPVKEASVGRFYPNSRHMAGDAVDLRTGGNQNVYIQQQGAGHKKHGCVEPVDLTHGPQTDYNHTHIDWRTLGSGHFLGPKVCPRGW